MATPEGFVLSADQVKTLDKFIYYAQRMFKNRQIETSDALDHEEMSSPEVYIARTPVGGIPALDFAIESHIGTGACPNHVRCPIFKLALRTGHMEFTQNYREVYNLSTTAIDGKRWIFAVRDKYGVWYAIDILGTGFPARTTAGYEITTGYPWERTILNDDGTFSVHPLGQNGDLAYCPDENTELPAGTNGWLFPNPDHIGTGTGTGTGTCDSEQYWIFIPVYRTRTTCKDGSLFFQISTDGGDTWVDTEDLGVDCPEATGTDEEEITVGGCGWVAGLRTDNCLSFRIIEATGYCFPITIPQNLTLVWNGTKWESGLGTPGTFSTGTLDDYFYYIEGRGLVHFWIENGVPKLTINGIYLVWDKCGTVEDGGSFIDFTGGNTLCNPEGTADEVDQDCNNGTFTVRIECAKCPMHWYCVAISGSCNGTDAVVEPLELTAEEAATLAGGICSGPYETEAEALAVCGSVLCSSTPISAVIAVISGSGPCAASMDGLTATVISLGGNNYSLAFDDPTSNTREVTLSCTDDVWTSSKPLTDACQGGLSPTVTVINATHLKISTTFGGVLCVDCDNETITVEITVTLTP